MLRTTSPITDERSATAVMERRSARISARSLAFADAAPDDEPDAESGDGAPDGVGAVTGRQPSVESMSASHAPQPDAASDAAASDAGPFDSRHFRNVLGHFPTGVTVVTAIDPLDDRNQPVGFTIGSFTSVSLDPPLVGFLPQTDSDTWVAIERSGRFVVNELNCLQGELCWRFATSGNEDVRFDGVGWHPAPSGAPILDSAVAWIDCEIEQVYEMGDHYFVLGRVTALDTTSRAGGETGDEAGDEQFPLLFYKGMLGRFVPAG